MNYEKSEILSAPAHGQRKSAVILAQSISHGIAKRHRDGLDSEVRAGSLRAMPMLDKILNKIERRCGWLSFPGFLRYYALMNALVLVLQLWKPGIREILDFDREKVLQGEIWRVFTFIFASSFGPVNWISIILFAFAIQIMFLISDALEDVWGAFKATAFYYFGILCLIFANFYAPVVLPYSNLLFYTSAFFAFATYFPKYEFRIYFFIPVQIRFLAFIQLGLLCFSLFSYPLLSLFIIPAFLNYIIWAGIPALRSRRANANSVLRGQKFRAATAASQTAFHQCKTCDKTELADPAAHFRIATDGEEYCEEHLPKSATHVQ